MKTRVLVFWLLLGGCEPRGVEGVISPTKVRFAGSASEVATGNISLPVDLTQVRELWLSIDVPRLDGVTPMTATFFSPRGEKFLSQTRFFATNPAITTTLPDGALHEFPVAQTRRTESGFALDLNVPTATFLRYPQPGRWRVSVTAGDVTLESFVDLQLGAPHRTRPRAPTCERRELWTGAATAGASANVTNDGGFGAGTSYVVTGSTLSAIATDDGTTLWSRDFAPATLNGPAMAAPLTSGEGIFVTDSSGFIYRFDANGALSWLRNLKRPDCGEDTLLVAPTIQMAAWSNDLPDDVVMIPTAHGCGDQSGNEILALAAKDGAPKWTFGGHAAMDFAADACDLDYDTDTLLCGTVGGDSTLWALNTVDGSLRWSSNVGSLRGTPTVRGPVVYATSYTGVVSALDLATGHELWSFDLATSIVRAPWPEFRGALAGHIYVTDLGGTLYDLADGALVRTLALGTSIEGFAVSPYAGLLYASGDDGAVHQIDLESGAETACADIGAGIAYPPSLDTTDWTAIDRLTAVAGANVRYLPIPW